MASDIKDKIFTLRRELGLTLEEVANVVGVGKSTVRKWETGEIDNMKLDKVQLLAKALKTTPGYLMGWEEEPIGGKNTILAAHREEPYADLPEEAHKELENYVEYLRTKYKMR